MLYTNTIKNENAILFIVYNALFASNLGYIKIYPFGQYKNNWALVTKNHKLGFTDTQAQEVVAPIYQKINYFGEYKNGWALVKREGKYGFIDTTIAEVWLP